jgi:hypothetical protein
MREMKFRVWDQSKQRFVPSHVFHVLPDGNGSGAFAIMCEDWENYKEGEYFYPIDSTLIQYTGLKDKNGVEIYEGDVLEGLLYGELVRRVVEFDTGCEGDGFLIGGWLLHFDTDYLDGYLGPVPNAVIIGNIYANHELTGGSHDRD